MRGDIFALVTYNHLSSARPCSIPKTTPSLSLSVPIVPFAHENAQLQIPTVNRRFSRVLSPSLFFSLPSLFRPPPTPATFFSLFHHCPDFLGELSLFLLLFLCLFLSFSRVPDSHILDRGSFSLSLHYLAALLLSRSMHPAFLVIRGYLIPS